MYHVSYETSVLLKSVGFDLVCDYYYNYRKHIGAFSYLIPTNQRCNSKITKIDVDGFVATAPMILDVVENFYKDFNIWIYVKRDKIDSKQWRFFIDNTDFSSSIVFETPYLAYEAAILYVLKLLKR